MASKDYPGNASASTLQTPLVDSADTTCQISTVTGWPTGSSGQWVARISRGVAGKEEKILITSRDVSGNLVIGTRGYDGTTAVAHDAGEPIECVWDAVSARAHEEHVNNTGLDQHTQYHNTARHAAVSHVIGTHLPAPSAPATPVATGSASAGSSPNAARQDHVHDLPTSIPRGVQGTPVQVTSGASIPNGGADLITHGAVTVGPGTRRLRISAHLEVQQTGALSGGVIGVQEGSTVLTEHAFAIVTTGQIVTMYVEHVGTFAAGSHTFKVRGRSNGANACAMLASSDSPARIMVEDIGV